MIARNQSWYYILIAAWALNMGFLGAWLVDKVAKYHFNSFGYFYIGCVSVALWLITGYLYRRRGFNAWTCIALGIISPLVGSVAVSFFAFLDVIFYCWVFSPIGLCTALGMRLIWRLTTKKRTSLSVLCSTRFRFHGIPGDFHAFLPLASELMTGHATRS